MKTVKIGDSLSECPHCGKELHFVLEGEMKEAQPTVGTLTLNVVAKLFEPHDCFKVAL